MVNGRVIELQYYAGGGTNMRQQRLSDGQVKQYRKDGYLVYGDLLTPREVEKLRDAYMVSLDNMRAENKLKNSLRSEKVLHQIRVAHLHHPDFNELLHDARILDLVEDLIGPNIRLIIFQGVYKPPLSGGMIPWHQDDFYFHVYKKNAVVSAWLTLDDTDIHNGCMWVVPGAHQELLEHVPNEHDGGSHIRNLDDSKAIPLEMKAGQLMFHHGLAPHRTLENTTERHRRVLAMHFMDAMAPISHESRKQEPPENVPILRGAGIDW